MTTPQTFRDLDQGHATADQETEISALDEWYDSVRDIPINELDDGDLSRACRQCLFPQSVVPVAVRRLQLQPLAGDSYDGELFASLRSVPRLYWKNNPEMASIILMISHVVLQQNEDGDLKEDARIIIASAGREV